jgi:NAD(P)-dependent dehydrogenase (short-subunit alcohol dehydrogenase family)
MLSPEKIVNSGIAYIMAKRGNQLRVRKAAIDWGKRGARINTISPGVVVTPLAYDEFRAAGEGYQKMIETSAMHRVGNPAEIANAAQFLLSDQASFITGTDLLVDGGTIAAIKTGEYKLTIQ